MVSLAFSYSRTVSFSCVRIAVALSESSRCAPQKAERISCQPKAGPRTPIFAVILQAVFIPLGICTSGGYSKGPRGKDPALDQACIAKCVEQNPSYADGACPLFTPAIKCPSACTQPGNAREAWVVAAAQAVVMVLAPKPAAAPDSLFAVPCRNSFDLWGREAHDPGPATAEYVCCIYMGPGSGSLR